MGKEIYNMNIKLGLFIFPSLFKLLQKGHLFLAIQNCDLIRLFVKTFLYSNKTQMACDH